MCKIQNFVAEFYSLKVKNYLNCGGQIWQGWKKLLLILLQIISNLILHVNNDIILFANRLFLASM